MELFKLLSSILNFFTSFHPQTDGQIKGENALLKLYLWHFVSENQHDWAKLLDIAQYLYNLWRSEVTNRSPFELAVRQPPMTFHFVIISYKRKSPTTFKVAKRWYEQVDIGRLYLDKATKKMKKWANTKRHVKY